MTVSATLTQAISVDGVVRTGTAVRAEGNRVSYNELLAQNLTDKVIAGAIDVSALKMIWIKADQAITLKFVHAASEDVLTLLAGEPVAWYSASNVVCPITADVTHMEATTGASIGNTILEIEWIIDPTP